MPNSVQTSYQQSRNGKEWKGSLPHIKNQNLEKFWDLYPFKINYDEVEDYFERTDPRGDLFNEIIDGVKKYKNYVETQERHNLVKRLENEKETTIYTMKPLTWLTRKRWKEDYKFTRDEEIFIMREKLIKNNNLDCYYSYEIFLKKQSNEELIELFKRNQIPDEDFFPEYNREERFVNK